MKNKIKFFGIIVMVTVIGFSMAACNGEPIDDMRITITQFDDYNERTARLELRDVGSNVLMARGEATIQRGRATFYMMTGLWGATPFDTTGNYAVTLMIDESWFITRTYRIANRRIGLRSSIRHHYFTRDF